MSVCGFKIKHKLGQGTYASVYLSEEGYAIKVLKNGVQGLVEVFEELDILKQVNHPNVVMLYKILFHDNEICLVMPAGSISLENYIYQNFKKLEEVHKNFLTEKLITGLDYLHKNFILHLDLHGDNIILYKDESGAYYPKIADFGLSKRWKEPVLKESFTIRYTPPEVLINLIENKKTFVGQEFDNWYLGIVIFLIWNGKYPFFENSPKEVLAEIDQLIGSSADPNNKYILNPLLVADPKKRILDSKENHKYSYVFRPIEKDNYVGNNKKITLEWLWEVTKDLKYSVEVYFETIEILEQIIRKIIVNRKDLQMVALIAFNLATILLDRTYADSTYVYLSEGAFTEQKFTKWRLKIVEKFAKGLFKPTLTMLNPDLSIKKAFMRYTSFSKKEVKAMLS